jgi:hypothetical protein
MKKKSTVTIAARTLEVLLTVFSIVFGAICIAGGNRYGLLQAFIILGLLIALRVIAVIWSQLDDSGLRLWILVFIIMTKVLGNIIGFYTMVPQWDKLEHFFSGFLVVCMGSILYDKLSSKGDARWNSKLKCCFLLFLAGAAALWWEVFEFSMDSFFNMHCQGGLADTMWDGIMGTLGGAIMVLYIAIRKRYI